MQVYVTNSTKLLGINRRDDRRCATEWRPYGGSVWTDLGQRFLHSYLSFSCRARLVNALGRRRLLLVISTESNQRPQDRFLHWISQCLRMATLCLLHELYIGQ